jgi:NAD(P)H-hydrate repair Nnr-like enzyme with NAD(P)H-hydrate epimerase domain
MNRDRGIVIVGSGNNGTIAHVAAERLAADIIMVEKLAEIFPTRLTEPESLEFVVPKRSAQLPETRRERRAKAFRPYRSNRTYKK